jgi:hypothetical protein
MNIKARQEFYSQLRKEGRLHGTIRAALTLWEKRQANKPPEPVYPGRISDAMEEKRWWHAAPTGVPLGPKHASEWLDRVQALYPRFQNWKGGAEAAYLREGGRYKLFERGSNNNRHQRSTFKRGVYVNSTATCLGQRVAVLTLGNQVHEVPAPKGYYWGKDALGLKLIGRAGEYHPDTDDLIAGGKECVRLLKRNAQRRKAHRLVIQLQERTKKEKQKQQLAVLKKAEREGATVCLADSLKAGNCRAGSMSWASLHGLDPSRHYTPSEVLAQANGQADRVAIVVAFALRRHIGEMQRGYCNLADHVFN